jgi:hypothetical protein
MREKNRHIITGTMKCRGSLGNILKSYNPINWKNLEETKISTHQNPSKLRQEDKPT